MVADTLHAHPSPLDDGRGVRSVAVRDPLDIHAQGLEIREDGAELGVALLGVAPRTEQHRAFGRIEGGDVRLEGGERNGRRRQPRVARHGREDRLGEHEGGARALLLVRDVKDCDWTPHDLSPEPARWRAGIGSVKLLTQEFEAMPPRRGRRHVSTLQCSWRGGRGALRADQFFQYCAFIRPSHAWRAATG